MYNLGHERCQCFIVLEMSRRYANISSIVCVIPNLLSATSGDRRGIRFQSMHWDGMHSMNGSALVPCEQIDCSRCMYKRTLAQTGGYSYVWWRLVPWHYRRHRQKSKRMGSSTWCVSISCPGNMKAHLKLTHSSKECLLFCPSSSILMTSLLYEIQVDGSRKWRHSVDIPFPCQPCRAFDFSFCHLWRLQTVRNFEWSSVWSSNHTLHILYMKRLTYFQMLKSRAGSLRFS